MALERTSEWVSDMEGSQDGCRSDPGIRLGWNHNNWYGCNQASFRSSSTVATTYDLACGFDLNDLVATKGELDRHQNQSVVLTNHEV